MRLKFILGTAALLSASLAAHADTFNFSFTGVDSGSGTFTASITGTPGEYLVTAISGTVDGSTITALLTPGTFPTFDPPANDNDIFYPISGSSSYVDFSGIAFEDAAGTYFNLLYQGSQYGEVTATSLAGANEQQAFLTSFTLSAASTPEPSSIALLGTGLLGLAGIVKRRLA